MDAAGDGVLAGDDVRAAHEVVSAFTHRRSRAVMLPVAVTTVVFALLAVVLS
ncbi:hypothetical protein [Streptomyces sp. SID13588]|uniref:hypothetical protein n=1 Tax=Streptomyces sp. SID13588 TaxID=2706051 RepID=UPI0013CAD370|nr:hypothetical protein [Streptomyces sp. SID13588]NEA77500.1 hypothetical protein [Streptomyces sp. SID13588]